MEKILWGPDLTIEQETIDFQHKILVGLINDLIEAQTDPSGGNLWLEVVLDELKNYTEYHFGTESKLMKQSGYQGEAHQHHLAEHAGFVEQVRSFRQRFLTHAETEISTDLLHYLREWLTHHIQVVDRKFGDYLKAQAPSKDSFSE
jgi:hemerythrin-like metal-binding protein